MQYVTVGTVHWGAGRRRDRGGGRTEAGIEETGTGAGTGIGVVPTSDAGVCVEGAEPGNM